jgi:3-hydroxyacyl-[acyl-carrier-protein] dehydratase
MTEVPLYPLETIEAILPHRRPFLFVDRVVRLDPDRQIVAELDLLPEAPFFAGHFPGHPLMPGVLVTEALAQTSGLLLGLTRFQREQRLPDPAPLFYLAAVNVKFTHTALPGQTLRLRADAHGQFGGLFRFLVESSSGREVVASGHLTLASVDADPRS